MLSGCQKDYAASLTAGGSATPTGSAAPSRSESPKGTIAQPQESGTAATQAKKRVLVNAPVVAGMADEGIEPSEFPLKQKDLKPGENLVKNSWMYTPKSRINFVGVGGVTGDPAKTSEGIVGKMVAWAPVKTPRNWTRVEAGPLGGTVKCADTTRLPDVKETICSWFDDYTVGVAQIPTTVEESAAKFKAMRADLEK